MSMTVSESTVVPSQITVSPAIGMVRSGGREEAADFAEDSICSETLSSLRGMMLAGLFMPHLNAPAAA